MFEAAGRFRFTGKGDAARRVSTDNLAGRLASEQSGDSFARVTIPKRRNGSLLPLAGEDSREFGTQFVWIASHENVRSQGNRNWALGVLAEREARNAEVGGLFLNAAGVGDDDGCAGLHAKKLQIG
jgi:hypothetical protein